MSCWISTVATRLRFASCKYWRWNLQQNGFESSQIFFYIFTTEMINPPISSFHRFRVWKPFPGLTSLTQKLPSNTGIVVRIARDFFFNWSKRRACFTQLSSKDAVLCTVAIMKTFRTLAECLGTHVINAPAAIQKLTKLWQGVPSFQRPLAKFARTLGELHFCKLWKLSN